MVVITATAISIGKHFAVKKFGVRKVAVEIFYVQVILTPCFVCGSFLIRLLMTIAKRKSILKDVDQFTHL